MTGMGTRKGQASVGNAGQAPLPRISAGRASILRRSSTCFSALVLLVAGRKDLVAVLLLAWSLSHV